MFPNHDSYHDKALIPDKRTKLSAMASPAGLLLVLLFFLLPLAYWPTLYLGASLPRYFLIQLLAPIALFAWALSEQSSRPNWHPGLILILLFWIWAMVSTSWSPDPGTSLIEVAQLFSMVILAFLAVQIADQRTLIRLLMPAVLIGAGLAALTGLGQHYGFNPLELRTSGNQAPATFINRNHAANYFDYLPALAFAGLLLFRPRAMRWLAASVLGLSLAYLYVNKSRGSILALITGLVLLTIVLLSNCDLRRLISDRLRYRKKELALALFLPFVVIMVPSSSMTSNWNTVLQSGELDHSSNLRLAMYVNSLPAIADHPLNGLGYGGMRIGFVPYASALMATDFRTEDTVLRELHSDPLQYFVELGLPGGLLALLILGLAFRQGWQLLNHADNMERRLVVLGLWLAVTASAAHALVDFPLRLPASAAMFWLCIGLLLGLSNMTLQLDIDRIPARIIRPLSISIAVLSMLITALLYRPYLESNHDLYQAIYHLQKKHCLPAATASKRGLERFPLDFMLKTAHAQIYAACNFPPEQKLAVMNEILQKDPTIMRARLSRSFLYIDTGHPEQALPELETIVHALPHRPYAYAGLGDVAKLQGHLDRARFYYRAALRKKPDYKYAINQLKLLD